MERWTTTWQFTEQEMKAVESKTVSVDRVTVDPLLTFDALYIDETNK